MTTKRVGEKPRRGYTRRVATRSLFPRFQFSNFNFPPLEISLSLFLPRFLRLQRYKSMNRNRFHVFFRLNFPYLEREVSTYPLLLKSNSSNSLRLSLARSPFLNSLNRLSRSQRDLSSLFGKRDNREGGDSFACTPDGGKWLGGG